MTKVLLRHEGSSYVIDLDKLKTKTVREIVTEIGDDKLLVLTTAQAEAWDLDSLLDRALKPAPAPVADTRTTRTTSKAPKKETTSYRDWYHGLTGDAKAKADAHNTEKKDLNEHGPYPDWLKKAYAEAHP